MSGYTSSSVSESHTRCRSLWRVVLAEVAFERGLEPRLIEGNRRTSDVADARAEIAKRLLARGLSERQIAKLMHISVFSVQVYVGKTVRRGRLVRRLEVVDD